MINKKLYSILFLVLAVVSFAVIAPKMTSPETYKSVITSLDNKKDDVLKLTAAATTTSAAISALPGDTCTPIAEKLADMSGYFMIILCAIYLEKYLLTMIGWLTFKALVPVGALLLSYHCLKRSPQAKKMGLKLIFFGIAIVCVIPLSVTVSDQVMATYNDTAKVTSVTESKSDSSTDTTESTEAKSETAESSSESEKTGIAGLIESAKDLANDAKDFVNDTADAAEDVVTSKTTELSNRAQTALNEFIEAAAVMIITSCVIPILVILLFLWLIRVVLEVNIEIPEISYFKK